MHKFLMGLCALYGKKNQAKSQEECEMSIMIDLPPAMAQEAQEYATIRGTTLEQMLFDCIKAELARRRQADFLVSEFDALVEKTSSRRDRPYQFNRSDAYAEVMS